jgi:hypothetical protein
MQTIDFYASAPQYLEHMLPVWRELAEDRRGTFYLGPDAEPLAQRLGFASWAPAPVGPGDVPILVASSGNLAHARLQGRTRRAIMEHGCGLSYGGDPKSVAAHSPSYAGGDGRDAELFLHPGPHPAARDRRRYPAARVEVVGCPKLDTLPAREPDGIPTVAVSFHWDTNIAPETRSTFIHYRNDLALVARDADFRLLGHGHPRIFDRLEPWYRRKGITPVRDFADVCRLADVYVVDNSSTLYEFASTGRPVVVLNAPFYRRHIDHGLRFWQAADVGENVNDPSHLGEAVRRALAHPELSRRGREHALDLVYDRRPGAAERAARVLEDWAG